MKHMDPNARYLSLLSMFGKSKGQYLNYLLERILGKLKGWKQRTLSSGKINSHQSTSVSNPSLCHVLFFPPRSFLQEIKCANLIFLVGGSDDHAKIN